jgi:hypothetical protein
MAQCGKADSCLAGARLRPCDQNVFQKTILVKVPRHDDVSRSNRVATLLPDPDATGEVAVCARPNINWKVR